MMMMLMMMMVNRCRHAVGVWRAEVAVDDEHCAGNCEDIRDEREQNEPCDERDFQRRWR